MSEASETIEVVRQWVQKAENDLTNAAHTLTMKKGCPTDTVSGMLNNARRSI